MPFVREVITSNSNAFSEVLRWDVPPPARRLGVASCGILEFPMKQRDTTWPGTQIQAAFDRGH